ncbi:MAG TPA: sugar-binding protein [Rhodothermales bacterium]|nr:sugar-binding protein [Rhodothermales bacterium]
MKKPSLLFTLCVLLWSAPVMAQYGVGVEVDVTRAPDGAITLDGANDEPAWDLGAQFDLLANWDFYTAFASEPDLSASASVLWGGPPEGAAKAAQEGDWLYVYVEVFDNEIYIPDAGTAWQSDQILVGIDPTHAGDSLYDGSFGGGVANAPDKGPYAYKIWPGPSGITLNWEFDGVTPADSGWVFGTVFRDSTNLIWGVEFAAYMGEGAAAKAAEGRQIGFNIGGAQAAQAALDAGEGEATYGFFSQYVCELDGEFCSYAGGSVMSDARSFATLNLLGGGGGGEDYGVGIEVDVTRAPDGAITLDGERNEASWDLGAQFDLLANWDFYTGFASEPDLSASASVLWGGPPEGAAKAALNGDWLYVYVEVLDNEIYIPDAGEAWQADQILVGIDPTHENDVLYDGSFGGGVANAPDKGPYTYKIWPGPSGITLNWEFDGVTPADSGWVIGTVFRDSTNLTWGVEFAAYLGEGAAAKSSQNRQIGFNIGGAQAAQAALDAGEGEATYGYFSQYVCEFAGEFCSFAGGAVMSDARSFATLNLTGGGSGEGYGVNEEVQVPRSTAITIDGVADEADWANAAVFNPLANWDFYTGFASEPDLTSEARVLWDEDYLYVYVHVFDNSIYTPDAGEAWQSDQILIGIDPTHAFSDVYDASFGGGPLNAPDKGPYTYKVWTEGATLNWGFDGVEPADSGWVNAVTFVDTDNLEWGVELAAYVPQIDAGDVPTRIGFNIGGAQAAQEALDAGEGEATYGFFSHWVCALAGEFCSFAGGAVMSDSRSFGTLVLVETVDSAVEDEPIAGVPEQFALSQNYPNPFNPTTTIEYGLKSPARASVDVFNVYGQRVARLIDEQKSAGTYRLTWDSEGLPSGMYVYQLRIDGTLVDSKTMTLIK